MSVQKHNTYYDNELYYYDENGNRIKLNVGEVYSAGSGIKIENDIISVSGKYVASAGSALDGKQLVLKDNKWIELVLPPSSNWLPTIIEASANAYNSAIDWTTSQGYLTAHQIIPSAKWENASDVVESNSSKWNDGYTTLKANSADWLKEDDITPLATKEELNTASSTLNTNKLDKSVFDEYKDFVDDVLVKKQDKSEMSAYALSSWVDENYQKKGDYLSANALDLISETSGKWNEVSSKLDKNYFTAWSANYDEYVKSIENDVGNLKTNSSNWDSVYNNVNTNSAKWDAASDEVTSHSANWNSVYDTVSSNSANWNNLTAINTFSSIGGVAARNSADELLFVPGDNVSITTANNTITFSAKDTTYDENDFISASHLDNIVSVSATVKSNSANWNDVSSKANSADLTALSSKVNNLSGELNTTSSFLSGAIDVVSAEFEKVIYTSASAGWDVIPYSAGQNINIANHTISVSGLHNTTLTSTDDSVGITATTDASGNIQYDLDVNKIPGISGVNGVSAYYDKNTDQYIVDLEKNDLGFAKFSTSANVFTTSAVAKGYNEDLNVNPTKITFDNDQILLKTGFYHIDVQTNFNVTSADNNYYDVLIKSIPNAASITQMIDGSYAHTETVDLSFDVRITEDDTPIEISVENYKANETFAITNLNIHEIVSMPSQIKGGDGDYQAGDGITITNDTIAAKLGNGLEFNESNAIQVKLGSGLKFDESQGVQSIAIDNEVEDVVENVQKMEEDLDTKVTVNFDYANITDKFDFSTYGDTTEQGNLLGYLFAVPINNKIYAEDSVDTSGNPTKYVTKIGVYSHQTYSQNYIILGLYEYDPNYEQTDAGGAVTGYGRTVPFCDTGARQLSQGLNEFTVTHLNDLGETLPELKSSCLYYATIYISKNPGNGVNLAGCPGYATTFNTNPQITLDQTNVNINLHDDYPVAGKTRDQVSFNDMGWGNWAGQQNYHELPSAPRFFMQISNKVRPTI